MDDNMIFVFGSNKSGIHGAGAALYAIVRHGAVSGIGEGLQGTSYALPTKGYGITDMTLNEIAVSILNFIKCATDNPELVFKVTPVGTGLAGHSKKDIARLFMAHTIPFNVVFSKEWFQR